MMPHFRVVIVAMLSAFPVSADELVDRADANGDGYVSLYELRAAYYADMEFNRRIEQSFANYDTDGDGLISEAERRAQPVARAENAPEVGMAATASGKTAVPPATGMAPATAAGMASTPAAGTVATPAAEEALTPAAGFPAGAPAEAASTPTVETVATPAADEAQTPAAGFSAGAAEEMASSPAAETVSVGTPGMETVADRSGGGSAEVAPATTTADGTLPETRRLRGTELWILQIDSDNSGGASISELAASGDGRQWFPDSAFASADKNNDGDLDPDELEVLLQSMERRQRR